MKSAEHLNEFGRRYLAARMGITVTHVAAAPTPTVTVQMKLRRAHLAPHDYVHGGAIILLADTACGYGSFAILPAEASGFFTIESKTSHVGAVNRGVLQCTVRCPTKFVFHQVALMPTLLVRLIAC